jgi:hypothetical protein
MFFSVYKLISKKECSVSTINHAKMSIFQPATGTTMEPQALQKLELLQKERHWADFEYNL